nr:RNA-directed DNA polymerase, eukaryota [Tanacetum cinerariifolium]
VISRDLACHVMGKVKDIESIPNLRTLLSKKGFPKVKLSYLSGLWVMIELENEVSKSSLVDHVGVNSWFHIMQEATQDFLSEERVVWVDIEGVPLNFALDIEDNSGSSFARKRICVLTKEADFILEKFKESDVDGVSETVFGENSSSHQVSGRDKDIQQSEDPFCLYDLLKKHPVGDGGGEDDTIANDVEKEKTTLVHANVMNTNIEVTKSSIGESTSIRTRPVHNGGSILDVLEDMVWSKKEWIKELNSKHRVNFLALQETKLDRVSHMDVKFLWGNSNFQFISSDSNGSSGDSIVMGDFNDVRCKEERLGSLFNPLGARLFNQFINSSGLVEVKLEGYSFTWSHPSASKMSKLDWFLVTEGMLSVFPSMTAICLDRHLSDHRPILLHEELGDIDKILDHGNVSDTVLLKRMELMRQLHDLNQVASRDAAQKSKIKWAIEGDKNSKFFHGIINKKRSYLSIRGVFVDGI